MKKRIKRLLSFTMASVLVALSLSTSVLAASEEMSLETNSLETSVDYDMDNIKFINTSTGEVYEYEDSLSEEGVDIDSVCENQSGEETGDYEYDRYEEERLEEFFKALGNDELEVMDISSEEYQSNLETYSSKPGQELKIWVCEQGTAEKISDYDFSYVDGRLKLSKEGYYPVDVNAAEVGMADALNQTKGTVKLALVPTSSESNIAAVYCNGKDVLAEDVSIKNDKKDKTNVYVVTADGTDKDADIAVIANKYDPKRGALIYKKSVSENCVEIPINPPDIESVSKGENFYFRIFDDHGENRDSIRSNLKIVKNEPNINIGFDRDLSFKIPSNVPVIGDAEVSLELAQFPVKVKVEDTKIRIGLNTRADCVNDGKKWQEYKTMIEDSAKHKQVREDSINQFLDKKNTPFKAGFKGNFNLSAAGMIELDFDDQTGHIQKVGGYVYVTANVAVNGEWQVFVVVIPVVIKVSVSVGLNAFIGVGYDIKHHKAYLNGNVSFVLPSVRLSGGIGCAKVADVSLYGQGSNKIELDMTEERGILTGALEGEAGVSVKIVFFKYSKTLWKGRWQYFRGTVRNGTGQNSAQNENNSVVYYPEDGVMYTSFEDAQAEAADLDNYEIDRSYIDNQSEWLPVEENQDIEEDQYLNVPNSNRASNTVTLQRGVFFSASPQIIASEDGTKLLVWTSDIKERPTGDHTAIVYSVYDDMNNAWCEPKILNDDWTLDSDPQVVSVGDKIYIAWMNSSEKGYGDEVSPEDIANDMDISVAEFDTKTKSVTKIMDTGRHDGLEMYPRLSVHNGEAHLVWVTNSENDFYGEGTNIVKYANLSLTNGNTISGNKVFSTKNAIEDIVVGEIGSTLSVSYILDSTDSSKNDNHDHGIHVISVSGDETDRTISENKLEKPGLKISNVNDKNILTWCTEGKIYYSEDGEHCEAMETTSDISPDYVFVKRNGKDVLLCTNSSEKETDIFYHEMDGYSIKKPVQISDVDEYITSFSAAEISDSLEIAYSKTRSSITNEGVYESRDICIESIPSEGYNEVVIEDIYHDEKDVKSNAKVKFTITVKNNGLNKQDHVRYTVYKEDAERTSRKYIVGNLNDLKEQELNLPVGETASFTIDVPVGEIEGNTLIGVMVESEDNDHKNPHYDVFDLWIGYPDLELSLDFVNSDYNYAVNAIVSNVGAVDTKAYLNIIEGGTDGEILKTCYLGNVKAGETNEYEISSDILNSINFNQELVTFEVVSTTEEYYLSNNTDYIHKHIDGLVVRFDANGGECKTTSKTIAPGDNATYGGLPQAYRTGYKFLGWYDGDTKITSDTKFTENSPRELLAKWEANEYTVFFDTGYDINIEPKQVKYGEKYGKLPEPVLPGVDFIGWYLRDENEVNGYEINSDDIVETAENHVLYAQVKPKNDVIKPVFYNGETGEVLTGNATLTKGTTVKLKTETRNASLYYTTNRLDPDPMFLGGDNSEGTYVYEDEIVISKNVKIKAIATKHGYGNSPVAALNVTVEEDWGDIDTDTQKTLNNDISKVPAGLWISGVEDKAYTGKAIKQDIKVYYHTTLLKEKQDYTVSYKNNTKAGNALITVTGKRGCKGKITEGFLIGRINIGSSRLIADDIILEYNGKVKKGKTTVKYRFDDRTVTLKEGRDFIYDHSTGIAGHNPDRAFLEEGDYKVLICGIGNYDGSNYFNEKITKCSLISKAKVTNIKALNYDGTAKQQPDIVVKYAGKKLVAGEDYKVSYENNIMPGTATVVITGINKFIGTKKVNFAIKGTNIKNTDITITDITSYTGDEIKPKVHIKKKNSVSGNLIEGEDYKVSYSNNIKASKKAKIIIEGLNGYTGTVSKTFIIKPYEIKAVSGNRVFAYADASTKYTKGGTKPLLKLLDGSYTLINGKDYKIKYTNNANVHDGTGSKAPTMEVSGTGNYSGKIIFKYAIEKKSINDTEISISAKDVIYKNKTGVYKSKLTIKDVNGKTLTAGKDYKDIVYRYGEDTIISQKKGRNDFEQEVKKAGDIIDDKDIIPVGTEITVTVSGIGNYKDEGHTDFRCITADISKAKIVIAPQYYTGKAVHITRNDITSIKIGKEDLRREDFEIVGYKNNINPGKATVIIRGKGGLGGEKAVTFTIMPQNIK